MYSFSYCAGRMFNEYSRADGAIFPGSQQNQFIVLTYKAKPNKKEYSKQAKLHGAVESLVTIFGTPYNRTYTSKNINIKFFIYLCMANTNIFNNDGARWRRSGTLVNIRFANVFIKFIYTYIIYLYCTFICSQQTRLEWLYRIQKSRYRFLFCVPGYWHGSYFHFCFNIQMRANSDIIPTISLEGI